MPSRRLKLAIIRTIVYGYVAGFVITLVVLEVRLFATEGLRAWFTLEFLIPFFQALVWPAIWLG